MFQPQSLFLCHVFKLKNSEMKYIFRKLFVQTTLENISNFSLGSHST